MLLEELKELVAALWLLIITTIFLSGQPRPFSSDELDHIKRVLVSCRDFHHFNSFTSWYFKIRRTREVPTDEHELILSLLSSSLQGP